VHRGEGVIASESCEVSVSMITTDILLEGIRRDDAFAWLSDPIHIGRILEGAFASCTDRGSGTWEVRVNTPPRPRAMGIVFKAPDSSHGGRRILLETTGKRTRGTLNLSLRTMKPSSNTLVTIRLDYQPGGLLGAVIDGAGLQAELEACFNKVLENLDREVPRT